MHKWPALGLLLLLTAAARTSAQVPTAPQPTRPVTLPPSGRGGVPGSVSVEQNSSAAGTNTITPNIQVSGDFQGSVPGTPPPSGPLNLTLAGAVHRGLQTNLGMISATTSSAAARAERIQMLSALLPNISANASENVSQVNLAAYGFTFSHVPAGVSIPSIVGPFSYTQAQGVVSQSVYDPVAIQNWKASKELENGSRLEARDARELVVLAVASSYLQTVATAARIESQRAQVENAQAVYDQAQTRKSAGTNSRIDVMRTLVELQTQKQRLNSLESDWRKQKLALARAIGLPLESVITLTDPLNSNAQAIPDPASAVSLALQNRQDLQAASAQIRAAERGVSAARSERLPSLSFNGDYGVAGQNPSSTHGVFTASGSLNIPIWAGGRTRGDIAQAEAALQQRRAEYDDQRGRVEQEVRNSLIELETATGQVELAANNRSYAEETLREARDRFALGVATTVEVVQAQEQVASAESDYVSSLLSLDLARLSLSRAVGQAEASLPDLLKGEHQ